MKGYIIDGYLAWRRAMESRYGRMIYGGSNVGYITSVGGFRTRGTGGNDSNGLVRVRYDGPICIERPDLGDSWTVTDPASPYFKFTNCRASLLTMGFTNAELDAAKEA